jgi:hypothetical protein
MCTESKTSELTGYVPVNRYNAPYRATRVAAPPGGLQKPPLEGTLQGVQNRISWRRAGPTASPEQAGARGNWPMASERLTKLVAALLLGFCYSRVYWTVPRTVVDVARRGQDFLPSLLTSGSLVLYRAIS